MATNSDILIKVLNEIAVIELPDALNKIVTALPGNIKFLNLKAQLIKLDRDKDEGLINAVDYDTTLNNKRRALTSFMQQLKPDELNKVYNTFFLPVIPSISNKDKIFINYRKEDSSGYALALYNELCKWYDKNAIFKDFHNIKPGNNFEDAIDEALNECSILLVIISDRWIEILKQRSNDLQQKDFVKLEISTALFKDIYIIPVIINKVAMPVSNELPVELKALSKKQYLNIDQTRFENDTLQLVKVIDEKLKIERDY